MASVALSVCAWRADAAVNGAVDSVKPDDPVTGKAKSYFHKETATAASVGYFTGFLMIFR